MATHGHTSPGADFESVAPQADVHLINSDGAGDFVLVCEHASHFIPDEYDNLGLGEDLLTSHIAWDPGAMPVAKILSAEFDAPLVAPVVSRLVYDCNRPTRAQSAVPEKSEIYNIPGNMGLSDAERQNRAERFYLPYRNALTDTLEKAVRIGRMPAVVTIHSFTPVYKGVQRELDIGILHDTDERLANEILKIADHEGDLIAQRNEPYGPQNGVTYTLVEHALTRGLLNVMIEIRNDLIATEAGQREMSARLIDWLKTALANLEVDLRCEVSR